MLRVAYLLPIIITTGVISVRQNFEDFSEDVETYDPGFPEYIKQFSDYMKRLNIAIKKEIRFNPTQLGLEELSKNGQEVSTAFHKIFLGFSKRGLYGRPIADLRKMERDLSSIAAGLNSVQKLESNEAEQIRSEIGDAIETVVGTLYYEPENSDKIKATLILAREKLYNILFQEKGLFKELYIVDRLNKFKFEVKGKEDEIRKEREIQKDLVQEQKAILAFIEMVARPMLAATSNETKTELDKNTYMTELNKNTFDVRMRSLPGSSKSTGREYISIILEINPSITFDEFKDLVAGNINDFQNKLRQLAGKESELKLQVIEVEEKIKKINEEISEVVRGDRRSLAEERYNRFLASWEDNFVKIEKDVDMKLMSKIEVGNIPELMSVIQKNLNDMAGWVKVINATQ